MGSLVKILTGILGILAVIACLTTIGVIGYTLSGAGGRNTQNTYVSQDAQTEPVQAAVPTSTPESSETAEDEELKEPVNLIGHIHDYAESVDKKATCYQAGRLKYTCEDCGDIYYVDVASTGHVPDDEWELAKEAAKGADGLRVKRCIYCDEIVAEEVVRYEEESTNEPLHTHEFTVSVEREPSCILAGLRKYTCSCGSFYTEQIPAPGHVATDWTVVEESTASRLGREQRTCTVCGVVLDSRPIPVKKASPEPSASTASTAPTATPTKTPDASPRSSASPSPSATPHSHEYVSYIIKEANCKEKGIRSFVCSCGSSYAESIELDLNRHDYFGTVIPATTLSPGYTLYRCRRCNATYMDNYTQILK